LAWPPRKKLLLVRPASGSLDGWLKLDGEAELGKLGKQTLGFELGRAAVEVGGAEIAVFDAVLEHMIDRREERAADSADGPLASAFALQAEGRGSGVACLFCVRR